jgi:hypothetical protein
MVNLFNISSKIETFEFIFPNVILNTYIYIYIFVYTCMCIGFFKVENASYHGKMRKRKQVVYLKYLHSRGLMQTFLCTVNAHPWYVLNPRCQRISGNICLEFNSLSTLNVKPCNLLSLQNIIITIIILIYCFIYLRYVKYADVP